MVQIVPNYLKWAIIISILQVSVHGSKNYTLLFETALNSITKYVWNDVSSSCRNEVEQMFRSLPQLEMWSLQMLDASAKIPSGILEGNGLHMMGSYGECLSINEHIEGNKTTSVIRGKYCNINVPIQMPMTGSVNLAAQYNSEYAAGIFKIKIGLCIPRGCTDEDIQSILGKLPFPSVSKPTLGSCFDGEKKPLDTAAIIVITIWAAIGAILVTATVLDFAIQFYMWWIQASSHADHSLDQPGKTSIKHSGSNPNSLVRFLMIFSMYQNGKTLFSVSDSGNLLSFLNGMRFLSIAWIVLGHSYIFPGYEIDIIDSFKPQLAEFQSYRHQLLWGGMRAVDTFLFMSGLLVTYVTFQKLREYGRISPIAFYLHRYWRLLPPLAMLISWIAIFEPLIVSGPSSALTFETGDNCKKHFWKNILFINNFGAPKDYHGQETMCLSVSWYLALDFQLYVLSPLVMYPLYKHPRIGYSIMAILTIASFIASGIMSANTDNNLAALVAEYYTLPYCRLSPYVVGMLIGYILQHPDWKINLKPIHVCCCWVASSIICLSIVYGPYSMYQEYLKTDSGRRGKVVMFAAFAPFAWSVNMAWITVACVYGYGGIVKRFLGWSFWAPWARLAYCIYLLHPVVLFRFISTRQNKYHFDYLFSGYLGLSTILMTILVAIPFSLAFESPMIGLEKFLFTRKRNVEQFKNVTPVSISIGKSDTKDIEVTVEA